jgi:hypothetical protein
MQYQFSTRIDRGRGAIHRNRRNPEERRRKTQRTPSLNDRVLVSATMKKTLKKKGRKVSGEILFNSVGSCCFPR